MPGSRTPHLWRRGGVFYFRRVVPLPLQSRIGRSEIKPSLQTREPARARLRCRALSNRFDAVIEILGGKAEVSQDRIETLLKEFLSDLLGQAEEVVWMIREDDTLDASAEADAADEQCAAFQAQIASGELDGLTKEAAKTIVSKANHNELQMGVEEFEEVCSGVLRAKAEQRRILAAMLGGVYNQATPTDPLFIGVKSSGRPPPPRATVSTKKSGLGQIVEAYIAFK